MKQKEQILLIEDNQQNCYLATYLLERNGMEVTWASTGPSGLGLAAKQPFDLILLDIQLPGMNGYDVARSLRTIAASRNTPIVAITSYAMVGDREKALAAGCTGYLEKPINPVTFATDIEAYIADSSGDGKT